MQGACASQQALGLLARARQIMCTLPRRPVLWRGACIRSISLGVVISTAQYTSVDECMPVRWHTQVAVQRGCCARGVKKNLLLA